MSALPLSLLPGEGWRATLPWLVAAAAFLMALAAAASLALGHAAAGIAAGEGRVTIVLAAPDANRAADRAIDILTRSGLVAGIERVSDGEVRRLVATPPFPVLIDATLQAGATPSALRAALQPLAGVTVSPQAAALAGPARLVAMLRRLAAGAVIVAGLVAGGAAMLVARSGLSAHAPTIAILHGLGATDVQIARLFERRAAREALIGGAIGLAVGLAALLGFGPPTLVEAAILVLLPPAIALIALVAARLTVLVQLRRAA